MRLVLVHGINQQGKSSDVLAHKWLGAMREGAVQESSWPESKITNIQVPFYGDRLFALSETKTDWSTVTQGADEADDEFADFAYDAFAQMAMLAGVTQEEIEKEMGLTVVELGAGIHKKWLKAIAKVLERKTPGLAKHALKLLKQAHAYVKRPHISREINEIVRPALDTEEEMVIVSHSLGTIVTYALLREFAQSGKPRNCKLFMTLGSPLGIDEIRKAFPMPRGIPNGVKKWFNGADPEDFVALHGELAPPKYAEGIINITDIENGHSNPHDIEEYLKDSRVAQELLNAI